MSIKHKVNVDITVYYPTFKIIFFQFKCSTLMFNVMFKFALLCNADVTCIGLATYYWVLE